MKKILFKWVVPIILYSIATYIANIELWRILLILILGAGGGIIQWYYVDD